MINVLDCGHAESEHSYITRGYGIDAEGKKHCYACCAERDKAQMRSDGKIVLYLTHDSYAGEGKTIFHGSFRQGKVTNWPASLSIPCRVKRGKHNMARWRYDCWFAFEGAQWHGVQYGDNTQIVYCRRIKEQANAA